MATEVPPDPGIVDVSVIVPTFNEGPNVAELVRRIHAATGRAGRSAEILFVDDSTDDTPGIIAAVAAEAPLPVRLLHRDHPVGGLGGAVVEGIAAAASDRCVVMDGDLQHPPEKIPELLARADEGDLDVVVASRYAGGGTAHGLAGAVRVIVSRASTLVTKAMFPMRLRGTTDPMTGFFLVDRGRVDFDRLAPRGFKILLEILARQNLRVGEIDFDFGERHAGHSKASFRQGMHFARQLAALRFGRASRFAIVGGLGAVGNLLIVAVLTALGVHPIPAAILAAELTIAANFVLIDRFVFPDLRRDAASVWWRFAKSLGFNNIELAIRLPVVAFMVISGRIGVVIATAITLVVAFVVRFTFHALIVYAPRRDADASRSTRGVDESGVDVRVDAEC